MDSETDTTTFGKAAETALTNALGSRELSTTDSTTSTLSSQQLDQLEAENQHKRAFLKTFRRWEILFKRKDGDEPAEKWLIAEYFKSLGHLSIRQFDQLTDALKEKCIFFPAISECLAIVRPSRYDYASPFHSIPADAIGSPAWREAHRIERAASKLEIENRLKAERAHLLSQLPPEGHGG